MLGVEKLLPLNQTVDRLMVVVELGAQELEVPFREEEAVVDGLDEHAVVAIRDLNQGVLRIELLQQLRAPREGVGVDVDEVLAPHLGGEGMEVLEDEGRRADVLGGFIVAADEDLQGN